MTKDNAHVTEVGRGLVRQMIEGESLANDRRQLTWRVADAVRSITEGLVATTATEAELREGAERLERIAAYLERLPHGRKYDGVGEASTASPENAGGTVSNNADFAHTDYSPILGRANPLAPPLRLSSEGDVLVGTVSCGVAYEGPPGHVHGGIVAALFDELLGATQALSGQPGMTGQLSVSYRSPTPLHRTLRFEGRLEKVDGRKIHTRGTLHCDDTLCAEATGLFIHVDFSKLAIMEANRDR